MRVNRPLWIRTLSLVVPRDIRHEFVGNVLADRQELAEQGVPRWRRNVALVRELLNGFAQYAPLNPLLTASSPKPDVAAQAARYGWLAWRVAGPAMLLGYLGGRWWLLGLGALLLVAAYAALVTLLLTAKSPLSEPQSRLIAGLLGGTLSGLLLVCVFGVLTIGFLALASLFDSGLIAAFAVRSLLFEALTVVACVTLSGWVPKEWTAKRLVENADVRRREMAAAAPPGA